MTKNSKSNAETNGLAQEEDSYHPVILGVGAWGCQIFGKISKDENVAKFHTLVAMDSKPDNLEKSEASVKIHLDADRLIVVEQGLLSVTDYSDVFGEGHQCFAKADLIFVLVDTHEASLDNFLRCLGVLLSKAVIHRHALTIALLSNTEPSDDLVFSNAAYVTKHWQPDAYINLNLNKTGNYRYANTNAKNINPDSLFQPYVDTHTDIIRSISDPVIHKGLICVDFADVYSIFSNRGEVYFAIGASSRPDRASEAAVMACCIIEGRKDVNSIRKTLKEAGGVFVNIRAAEMDMHEFNQIGDVIHEFVGAETLVKIVTTVDDSLGNEMVVSVFASDNVIYTQI